MGAEQELLLQLQSRVSERSLPMAATAAAVAWEMALSALSLARQLLSTRCSRTCGRWPLHKQLQSRSSSSLCYSSNSSRQARRKRLPLFLGVGRWQAPQQAVPGFLVGQQAPSVPRPLRSTAPPQRFAWLQRRCTSRCGNARSRPRPMATKHTTGYQLLVRQASRRLL